MPRRHPEGDDGADGATMLPGLRAVHAQSKEHQRRAKRKGGAPKKGGPVPFSHTRLRAFGSKLNTQVGQAEELGWLAEALATPPSRSRRATPRGTPGTAGSYTEALGQLDTIQAELARMEGALSTLKRPGRFTTLGRPVHTPLPAVEAVAHGPPLGLERRKWTSNHAERAMPVSRGEAVILERTLDAMLPEGAVADSINQSKGGRRAFDATNFRSEFELVDTVFCEEIKQVASGCSEQGSLLEKVRDRCAELFLTLSSTASSIQQTNWNLQDDLGQVEQQLVDETQRCEGLVRERETLEESHRGLQERLQTLEREYSQLKEQSEAAHTKLVSQNKLLTAEVQHYRELYAESEVRTDEAAMEQKATMDHELQILLDERDDLKQELRFLTIQMSKARAEYARPVAVDHIAVQTEARVVKDGEGAGALAMTPGAPGFDTHAHSPVSPRVGPLRIQKAWDAGEPGASALSKGYLGHFVDVMGMDTVGRIHSLKWVLNCIAQLYGDKIKSDQQNDKDGKERLSFCYFIFEWHLFKFGLRHLAEKCLLDLVASVRHHRKECLKVQIFANFCGLTEDPKSTLEHLNFFLFCMQCMAGGPDIGVLFPESESSICWYSHEKIVDITKLIFSSIRHEEAAGAEIHELVVHFIEPERHADTQLYNTDAILLIYLEEWQRQFNKTVAHLKASLQTDQGKYEDIQNYDEFVKTIRLNDPGKKDGGVMYYLSQEMIKMYREALQLAPGRTIDADTFAYIARQHGLGQWNIDYTALPSIEAYTAGYLVEDEGKPDYLMTYERLFLLLDDALKFAEDNHEQQIETIKDKLGDGEMYQRIVRLYNTFRSRLLERSDADVAWAAYRNVLGEIESTMNRYRQGIKQVDISVADRMKGGSGGTSQTPLMIALTNNSQGDLSESALGMLQH